MCIAAAAVGGAVIGGYASYKAADKQADAQRDAARIQADYGQKVIDLYQPYVDAGVAQLPALENSATISGYGRSIGQILGTETERRPGFGVLASMLPGATAATSGGSGGGFLDPLIKERQRAATTYLSSVGLRRSGAAAREAAAIPTDLAMQIESELNRRRQSIVGAGQTGVQGAAGGLNSIGSALAQGKLGAAQAWAGGAQGIVNSIGGGIGNYLALSGGGGASPYGAGGGSASANYYTDFSNVA